LNFYLKILLIIFAVLYLISPLDIIPDPFLPFIGWLDDGIIVATIFYLIRHGKLPGFLFKKKGLKQSTDTKTNQNTSNFDSNKKSRYNNGPFDQNETFSQTVETPYEILGIEPNASKKEIKSAYRKAINKYHPDKLSHLGEDFTHLAKKKFIKIQKAYDTLMDE